MKYQIHINGCDDCTSFKMTLDKQQLKLVQRICALSEKVSTYDCMPKMTCKEVLPTVPKRKKHND